MMNYTQKAKIKHYLLNIICLTSVCLSFFLASTCLCLPAHCGAKQHTIVLSPEDTNRMVADDSESNIEDTSTPTPTNNTDETVGSTLVENTNNLVALGTVGLCILSFGVGVLVSHKFKLERK